MTTKIAVRPEFSSLEVEGMNEQGRKEIYKPLQTLGEGAFGQVLLVVTKFPPHILRAMKLMQVNPTEIEKMNQIRKEFLLQKKCSKDGNDHENVLKLIGITQLPDQFRLTLEYADGGELFDKIEPDVGMSAAFAQFWFRQLIAGLEHIHNNDIVHRDIKPENLLVTKSHVLKISDFGMATLYRHGDQERQLNMSCGTIPYAAPEICRGGTYRGPPIDVWSAGIVLIAMLTGELPWERAADSSFSYLCWLDNSNLDEDPWKKIDVRGLCILRKIVTDNVAKRATIEQIKSDPWFTHNYGKLETNTGKPLKRRHNDLDNDENLPNIACTQQVESASAAKRRHMDASTPTEKSTKMERHNASFSQPTYTDDLLLTQHIDMSQNNTNLLQRMVCRMTRFCVNFDVKVARNKVSMASEHAGFSVRNVSDMNLLVLYRDCSMMVSLYTMGEMEDRPRVMIDFRRSKGDGIQFKKMFIEVRNRMHDFICPDGNNWLAGNGFTPKNPQLVGGISAEAKSTLAVQI